MADAAAYEAARAEATGERQTFTVHGKTFHLDPNPPQWAYLEMVHALSASGEPDTPESEQVEALAAMYDFLRAVIDEADWNAFRRFMRNERITFEELGNTIITAVTEKVVGRPTEPPAPSDTSPSANGTSSTATSSIAEPAAQLT